MVKRFMLLSPSGTYLAGLLFPPISQNIIQLFFSRQGFLLSKESIWSSDLPSIAVVGESEKWTLGIWQ